MFLEIVASYLLLQINHRLNKRVTGQISMHGIHADFEELLFIYIRLEWDRLFRRCTLLCLEYLMVIGQAF